MTSYRYVQLDVDVVKENPWQTKEHPERQIDQIAQSMKEFGTVMPMVTDENFVLISGEGQRRAGLKLGLKQMPVIVVEGLSEVKKRALSLALNKLPQNGRWNIKKLGQELIDLQPMMIETKIDPDVLGFSKIEFEEYTVHLDDRPDPDERPPEPVAECVSQPGDVWQLDGHVVGCGDARDHVYLRKLMGERKADAGIFDSPYNEKVADIGGRGRNKHPEFAMASGEMSYEQFEAFVSAYMEAAITNSRNGAYHFHFMSWRHLAEVIRAGRRGYGELVTMAVWAKPNAGLGGRWRSQHEEVCIFRVGGRKHADDIREQKTSRSRSNLWQYRGLNQFGADRQESLKMHPTVKPIPLLIDALKDCTLRGDVVLDTFCGSGSTLMACERIGRNAVCVDIEPRYVDVTIRRWQDYTGKDAVHLASGFRFDELTGKVRRTA